jgi:hypothetical protein
MPLTFLSSPSCCRTPPPSLKLAGALPPSKKRRRTTQSTTSSSPDPLGDPRQHPSCPATSPHHPRAHAVVRTTHRPSAKPRHHMWPPRRARARSTGWHEPAGPLCCWSRPIVSGLELKCRPSTMRRFSDFEFSFNILEIHINFKNA